MSYHLPFISSVHHCARGCWMLLLVGLPVAAVGQTLMGDADLRIAPPDRPFPMSCYAIETETLNGAILLEEVEGDVIVGYGFGNVVAQSGESWGYLTTLSGQLDGAFLSIDEQTQVEGSNQDERHQWAFVETGLVTDDGLYLAAECGPIDAEYIRRVAD